MLDYGAPTFERSTRTNCLQKLLVLAVLLALIASGCAVYRRYEASKPETVRKTEAMLSDAGFTTIKVDTDEKGGLVEDLPPHEIRSIRHSPARSTGTTIPTFAHAFTKATKATTTATRWRNGRRVTLRSMPPNRTMQQVASLNALNGGFFPPPIFWIGGIAPGPHFGGGGMEVDIRRRQADAVAARRQVTAEVTASWPHNCSV